MEALTRCFPRRSGHGAAAAVLPNGAHDARRWVNREMLKRYESKSVLAVSCSHFAISFARPSAM